MSFSLPVNLLRQYCFCPRIPHFQELLRLKPPKSEWVKQGEALHHNQKQVFRHRSLKRFGLQEAEQEFNVSVSSATLQLHGIVDSILIDENAVYPIEFKLGGSKPARGQILQLVAYGMLLAEKYDLAFIKGYILYQNKGKTRTVIPSQEYRTQVLTIRDRILQDLEKGCLPDSSATPAQCTQCEYLNYCNDRH